MATQLAITLDEDQTAHLEALASARQETISEVATQAVAEYLAVDAAFRRAVDEGLASGRAGDVQDFEPFAEGLRNRMAIRVAESNG